MTNKTIQLGNNETVIKAGSLKALFVGNDLVSKPAVLEGLSRNFGLDYPNLPNQYPYERYLQMLDWLRKELYPTDSVALGYEKLGRSITKGFFQGPVGQVLKLSVNVMGVQRSTRYFFRIAGGALEFGRFELVEERPRYIKAVLYNVPGPADVVRGMGLEGMAVGSAKNATINYRKLNYLDTEYVAQWEE